MLENSRTGRHGGIDLWQLNPVVLPIDLQRFFFSSRRRHTRLQGDWSSDVCSSDLPRRPAPPLRSGARAAAVGPWSVTAPGTGGWRAARAAAWASWQRLWSRSHTDAWRQAIKPQESAMPAQPAAPSSPAMTATLYALVVLIWGSTWIALKLQLGAVPVELSIAYRFALAAVPMFA